MSSAFGFTNTSANTHPATPVLIKPVTVYGKKEDTPTSCRLVNKTTPSTQGEILSYQCTNIKTVNTVQTVRNPAPISDGVQYIVRLDEILRTTYADGTLLDEPIVVSLSIRHQMSDNVTNDLVSQCVLRLLGACMRTDGTYRFDDLMRSVLAPVVD